MKNLLFAAIALFGFTGAASATDQYCDDNCNTTQNVVVRQNQVSSYNYVAPVRTQNVRVIERVIQPQVYQEVQTVEVAPVQAVQTVVQRQYVSSPVVVQRQLVQQNNYQHSYSSQNVIAQPVIVQQQRQYYQQQNVIGSGHSVSRNFSAQRSSGGGRLFGNILGGGGRTVNRSFSASVTKTR